KANRACGGETPPHEISALVDQDSPTRRARRLGVEFDVAELCFASEAFLGEKRFPGFIKSLAPWVLWLACEVHFCRCIRACTVCSSAWSRFSSSLIRASFCLTSSLSPWMAANATPSSSTLLM